MSTTTIRQCDICQDEISLHFQGNGIVFGGGDYQAIIFNNEQKDICHHCLKSAILAMKWLGIELDKGKFYKRAGFTYQGNGKWSKGDKWIIVDCSNTAEQS